MLKALDRFLNGITMYRLVLYYLTLLILVATLFSTMGILPYNPLHLLFSTIVALFVCWGVNTVFAKSYGASPNIESIYITAFILVLIINPVAPTNMAGLGFLVFASAWAMGSKYILALDKKHLFNPAAFGVALAALTYVGSATWWVGGNVPLLPFVLIGGLLIVRKVRRFDLALTFSLVALTTIVVTGNSGDPLVTLQKALLHTPFFFFASVMLTEPITMPPTRRLRMVYAALVGVLFAPNIHIASFYFSPEMALLAGNIFAFMVSTDGRFSLVLTAKNMLAVGVYEYIFKPDRTIAFKAGQYLEWTLPHANSDSRGNRRYFTIASSPTERDIHLGVKFYDPPSSFKKALEALPIGGVITAAQIAGDFVLPRSKEKKLVFIAGGIGITPFRSMVQYLLDTKEKRDIVLLYANNAGAEIAYREFFDQAAAGFGMKTVYVSQVDGTIITKDVTDVKNRTYYISGPPGMVDACKKTLKTLGVSRFNIKTDYFPGLA